MEEFLPVTYDGLNSFLRSKAETELNEDESRLDSEMDRLKQKIRQNQLPTSTEDGFLLWFLRSKKHDVERSFDQLRKYSYQRHNLMKYYGFVDFDKIRVPLEHGVCGVLPRRDAEGRALLFLRACMWTSGLCEADDVLRALQTLIHFCLEFPATQISGFCFVFDNHLASLDTLHLFLKYATVLGPTINAFPGRFQRIAFVNSNIVLRSILPLLMSIWPSKLKKRTSFYGDVRSAMPQLFDVSILPEEFGGTLGPINELHVSWMRQLQEYVPKLRATNKYFRRKNTVCFPDPDFPS